MPVANLDHYVGRHVEAVEETDGGWVIALEGDKYIHNLSAEYEMPNPLDLVGKALQQVALSSTRTTIYFGDRDNPRSTEVNLIPTQYGIVDEQRHGDEMIRPQAGPPIYEPPAYPEEREATGPTDKFFEDQQAAIEDGQQAEDARVADAVSAEEEDRLAATAQKAQDAQEGAEEGSDTPKPKRASQKPAAKRQRKS